MNGIKGKMRMPLVGVGTWQYNSSVAEEAVLNAFQVGYRHVDTAAIYGNQQGVGKALARAAEANMKRDDYFVTTKIPGGLNTSATVAAADDCLKELGVEYVDLMLIHFPASFDGKVTGPAQRIEQWKALEAWAKSGKALAIGVSHYCHRQLDDILSIATVPIALNQVEYHIGMGSSGPNANDDKAYCQSKGIVFMSFSTLCGPCGAPGNRTLIDGPLVSKIAKAHNVSGPQVSLKWAVQQGIPVIPKSYKPKHLANDFDLFSFNLSDAEMASLTAATEPPVSGGGDNKTSGDCPVPYVQDTVVFT
jgi:2,5-diketo-D-gluconate reductase A